MKRILIIEDDPLVASVYEKQFQRAGYDVEMSHDGQDGFFRLQSSGTSPQILLLDLMLPHLGGLDILRKIRAQKRFETLPVFIMTNAFMEDMGREAEAAGATRVFNKATSSPALVMEQIEAYLAPSGKSGVEKSAPPSGDLSELIGDLRKALPKLATARQESDRQAILQELTRTAYSIGKRAMAAQLSQVAQFSAALEAFMKQLESRPSQVNSSVLRTLAMSVEFLSSFVQMQKSFEAGETRSLNILVVDDDQFSRRAAVKALNKAGLSALALSSPTMVLEIATENKLDLVVLDVDMPEMNGFELCKSIRNTPDNLSTPVIFVTGLSDFDSQTQAAFSGGNDLLAKPFIPMELGLKALLLLEKSKLKT